MEKENMKKCPFCAELIKEEAVKCRYCGSLLDRRAGQGLASPSSEHWRRVEEGKKIAGVCTGIARELDSPVLILPLRVFFVLTAFMGFGIFLYLILWILMPPPDEIAGGVTGATRPEYPHESAYSEQPGKTDKANDQTAEEKLPEEAEKDEIK